MLLSFAFRFIHLLRIIIHVKKSYEGRPGAFGAISKIMSSISICGISGAIAESIQHYPSR